VHKTHSNSDGHERPSLLATKGTASLPGYDSSSPCEFEETYPYIRTPEHAASYDSAQLDIESRRLDFVWRETEKQWMDKYGMICEHSSEKNTADAPFTIFSYR
jgi:hypothetical protein